MSIRSEIIGGGNSAGVSEYGALRVWVDDAPLPPANTKNRVRYYRSVLQNMNVDGSTTAQTFSITADAEADIYITRFSILIADTAVVHNSFGNVSALTNGWTLNVFEQGDTTPLIDSAQTGGQVIAQSGTIAGNAESASSYELINWAATEDAQLITIDIGNVMGRGIRLGRNSKDKINSIVRDDLTGLTAFRVYFFGYKLYDGDER